MNTGEMPAVHLHGEFVERLARVEANVDNLTKAAHQSRDSAWKLASIIVIPLLGFFWYLHDGQSQRIDKFREELGSLREGHVEHEGQVRIIREWMASFKDATSRASERVEPREPPSRQRGR